MYKISGVSSAHLYYAEEYLKVCLRKSYCPYFQVITENDENSIQKDEIYKRTDNI